MKKKPFPIGYKEIVFILAPIVVVAIVICMAWARMLNLAINVGLANQSRLVGEKVSYEARMDSEPPAAALESLAQSIKANPTKKNISDLLKAFANYYPQCIEFYYSTATPHKNGGWLITNDDWEAPADFEYAERLWYTGAVAAKGKIYYTEPYISKSNGKLCITYSIAIYDARNEFIGITACDLLLDKLEEAVANINFSKNTSIHVLDADGRYLTHKDPSYVLEKNYFEETHLDKKVYNAQSYLDGIQKAFVKNGYFFSVKQIENSSWFAVVEGPISDFSGQLAKPFFIMIAITALLIIGIVIFYGKIITSTRVKEAELSEKLLSETQNLFVSAKENAATSQDQSAAVKEIVATMEDNNALSESISEKIKGVSDVAAKTNSDVADGVTYLAENVRQLHEIADANQTTIDGIKSLGAKISNIWDIVSLINSVADQAKIIAFNAELEASSAGDAGRNFHIVATEIRRLADGIIDGTKEIKERITEIQQSSDSLILASENGTTKINEGVENASVLSERFESIKGASEITATSSSDITTIIHQQTVASEQILITLKQIASGVENFTAATENISQASKNLSSIASELNRKRESETNA
ncbi:MAG: hypothetical protein J5817_01970 [Treponema sp.]|nr:hypothetical protein [Treponema sp.]